MKKGLQNSTMTLIESLLLLRRGSMHKPTDSFSPNQRDCSGSNHSLPFQHPLIQRVCRGIAEAIYCSQNLLLTTK